MAIATGQSEMGAFGGADPELVRHLADPDLADEPMEAVIVLQSADAAQAAPSPEETERVARRLIDRVAREVGSGARDVHVFRYLGTFIVAAEPTFLRTLLRQPEIASATMNRPSAAESDPAVPRPTK